MDISCLSSATRRVLYIIVTLYRSRTIFIIPVPSSCSLLKSKNSKRRKRERRPALYRGKAAFLQLFSSFYLSVPFFSSFVSSSPFARLVLQIDFPLSITRLSPRRNLSGKPREGFSISKDSNEVSSSFKHSEGIFSNGRKESLVSRLRRESFG